MSLIKPRTRGKQFVRHVTRLERENHETLHAYAHFLGESAEYVVNQLMDTVLAKDKEFLAWRAAHPQSCVPRPSAHTRTRAAARDAWRANTSVDRAFRPRRGPQDCTGV